MQKKSDGFAGQKTIVLPRGYLQGISTHPLIQGLYPTDIGYFPESHGHYRERPEGCAQNILLLCVRGRGTVTAHGQSHSIGPHTLVVLPADLPHCYEAAADNPWTLFWVHFSGETAPAFLPEPLLMIRPLAPELSARARLLFDDILTTLEYGYSTEAMIYASLTLSHLLGLCLFNRPAGPVSLEAVSLPVEESIVFMRTHLAQPMTLGDMAKIARLSPTHYSSLFRKKTGFSPVDYLIRLRIQEACRMLDTSGAGLHVIARDTGFNDVYYFSRAFKKITGLSPSAYRAEKKG